MIPTDTVSKLNQSGRSARNTMKITTTMVKVEIMPMTDTSWMAVTAPAWA
jgi:hypothetical protein